MGAAALFGGEEAAAAYLAGTGAELGARAAAAGGVTIGAAVVGRFAAGYGIGTKIDESTGASDRLSTAAVDVDRGACALRSERLGRCQRCLGQGDTLEAVGDGASAIGSAASSPPERVELECGLRTFVGSRCRCPASMP